MKYFKVKSPYWALIAATDEKKARDLYEDTVSEIIEEDFEIEEIEREKALHIFENDITDEYGSKLDKQIFEDAENEILGCDMPWWIKKLPF